MKPLSHRLKPGLRRFFKKPIGLLIRGSREKTVEEVRQRSRMRAYPKRIAVGDAVSSDMASDNYDLYIVDQKLMRKSHDPIKLKVDRKIYVSNPQGTISGDAWLAIENALRSSYRTQMVVEGEEDLLVVPAVLLSPEGSLIVYGQPREGLVLVESTRSKKAQVKKLLDMMEVIDHGNDI